MISQTVDIISQSISDLTDISKSLNAEFISKNGLLPTLEKEFERMRNTAPFTLTFEIFGDSVYMDPQKELVILRILQEAFNNVIKHANAGLVEVQLMYETDHIILEVRDDGVGFDLGRHSRERGFKAGLNNMTNRAKILNGVAIIETKPNCGTKIKVKIPY